jgi:hypothetical protein
VVGKSWVYGKHNRQRAELIGKVSQAQQKSYATAATSAFFSPKLVNGVGFYFLQSEELSSTKEKKDREKVVRRKERKPHVPSTLGLNLISRRQDQLQPTRQTCRKPALS